MPKKEKEKKSTVNAAVPSSLVEEERALEVYLVGYTETEVTRDLMVLLRINNEQHSIILRDAVKEATTSGQVAVGAESTPSLPPLLPLWQQLVKVGDVAVRETLLNHREANRVDVYSLPSAAGGGADPHAEQRPSRAAGEKKPKVSAAAATGAASTSGGAKGKGLAAGAGGHPAPPDGARCVGGESLSLIPLLTSTSLDVALPLSVSGAEATVLHFRVCCRDAPLLMPEGVLQSRPVVLRVGGVEGLPSVPGPAVDAAAKDGATASSLVLRARVHLGNACVLTPALSVAPSSHVPASAPAAAERPDALLDYHEHVLFLSALGNPLEVYRQLYSMPCTVTLWQSFGTNSSEEAVTSPLQRQAKKGSSEALLGSGAFSVRDFLSDDQLRFSESVQLLPDRSTISLAGGQTCLTTASTIHVSLDFLRPFPPLQHVDAAGTALAQNAFLTRAVVRLPYQAPWMAECLGLLLHEFTSFPRATEDVHLFTPPPPSPSADSQDALEKTTSGGRGGDGAAKAPTVGTGSSRGNTTTKGSAKPDGSNPVKASNRGGAAGAAAAPAPTEAAAPPAHRFDVPLQLVSPPGLSGFEVTDGQERVWCVEGTVPEVHHILTRLTAFLESHRYPDTASAMLFNAELFVPARAYLTFPALVTPPAGVAAAAALDPGAVGAAASPSSARASAVGAVALEVEPSGTGGRFHRVRLRTTLETLRGTQVHYVRHALSDDCMKCLSCLTSLLGATSMRKVEMRGWLPSAPRLIALERSFGQTLEKDDLYGATPPSSPTHAATLAEQAVQLADDDDAESGTATASFLRKSVMAGVPVGALAFFDGAIRTGGGLRRPIPAAARQRFPVVSWMTVAGTGEEVLCAFAHKAPTGLVQYHVEGQVVQAGSVTLLYVVKCVCLARSFTHSHNLEYEQLLRERQRAQQTRLMRQAVLWPTSVTASGAHAEANTYAVQRGEQQSGGAPASAPAIVTTPDLALNRRAPRTLAGGSSSSDDDEADGDDWLASDFYDHLDASPASREAPLSFAGAATKDRRGELPGRQSRKARLQPRRGVAAAAAQKTITNEELWRMYDERAPATTANGGATGFDGKLPPLHC